MIDFLRKYSDLAWLIIWLCGLLLIFIWDVFFLNPPDFDMLILAFFRTLFTSTLAVFFALGMGLLWVHLEEWASRSGYRRLKNVILLMDNLQRSAPQIIGLLIGYTILTIAIRSEHLSHPLGILVGMALTLAVVTAHEWTELFRSRIAYYREKDLIPALRVCGIHEFRIINRDILWYNSRKLLLQKSIALFGTAFFLQCAMDFIVSVGLTADIVSANFPATLGSVLAKMNSKQDIMAVGIALTDFRSWSSLLTDHLLGISVAAILIWTLVCFFRAADALGRRIR